MSPLIKWPGGKSSEFKIIQRFIPAFDRYIEPFFGGGAVFFNLPPSFSIINDISDNLMTFYSFVKNCNETFKAYLYSINNEWCKLKQVASNISFKFMPIFKNYRTTPETKAALQEIINTYCEKISNELTDNTLMAIGKSHLQNEINRMVTDKIFRTAKNEIKNGTLLSDEDLRANFITGFTSGYYMYLRNTLNHLEKVKNINVPVEYKIAVFYFVREFCYGSMFRYNKAGDFNIPYGGIAYNNKDFKKKIDILFSTETQAYFKNTQIYTTDFADILDMAKENDFIFLDPPYDTDFSDYENRCFNEQDQIRLEKKLHNIRAKFLLIIKNTPLISTLYQNNGYNVYAFDNKYAYCVKGRNDRNAVHLIVTNY